MSDLTQWEKSLDPKLRLCRDVHHAWRPRTVERQGRKFIRTLMCDRCWTIKKQKLDSSGFILNSSMIYPDGYLRPKGSGRITKEGNARIRRLGL